MQRLLDRRVNRALVLGQNSQLLMKSASLEMKDKNNRVVTLLSILGQQVTVTHVNVSLTRMIHMTVSKLYLYVNVLAFWQIATSLEFTIKIELPCFIM